MLVSPSLLTWYIVQDMKEAPKVSALKFLHPIVSTDYGGWLLLVFSPFPTTLNVKYLFSRSTEVRKRIRGFFYPLYR